jgi:serine/threonine-protein kinase
MRKHVSAAATLLLNASQNNIAGTSSPDLLRSGQLILSPETRLQYSVERLLGQGGFGQAFLATRLGRSDTVPKTVCVKVSPRIDGWLREAYFGQLLNGHPRAIRIYDTFPLFLADGMVLYCLVLEYATYGDLNLFLHRSGKAWAERVVRREIAGILQVLGKLHRGQMLHRDLTPMNVFVCDSRKLKLGDFGIARHQSNARGITVNTLNRSMVPSEIRMGEAAKWQSRDDVYQVGQLLAMLVKGDARERIHSSEVRHLACSDHLKEIIYRCIGERRKRYETADELIDALRNPPTELKSRPLKTLKGAHVAFTGILSRPRREATLAATKAGATVQDRPSIRTTVVVRGKPNPLQAAGRDGGLKLMEMKRLREKGHNITLLNEAQFWRLVGKK